MQHRIGIWKIGGNEIDENLESTTDRQNARRGRKFFFSWYDSIIAIARSE